MTDASVAFSGETAEKLPGPADRMSASVGQAAHTLSGKKRSRSRAADDSARKLSSPPEHPRVTRLRHRRLIAFLRDQGFHDSYNELTNRTRAHMSLWHLGGLVERGLWLEVVPGHGLVHDAVDGVGEAVVYQEELTEDLCVEAVSHADLRLQLDNGRAVSHADLRLRSISLSIFAVDEVRDNMNWETVRRKASLAVTRLAGSTPEMRGCIALPATGIKPHHLLTIASGSWSRRRYVKKKQTCRPEAIVWALKRKQLMVPSIGSLEEAKELLADLLDETIRPGVQLNTYGFSCPLQPGRNEGTNQHLVEAAGWDLDRRRYSRAEPAAAGQLHLQLKKLQELTGTFLGASPVVSGPGAVANLGAKPSGVSSG